MHIVDSAPPATKRFKIQDVPKQLHEMSPPNMEALDQLRRQLFEREKKIEETQKENEERQKEMQKKHEEERSTYKPSLPSILRLVYIMHFYVLDCAECIDYVYFPT